MSQPRINPTVLMTDTKYMSATGINAYEDLNHRPDKTVASGEFEKIQAILRDAGIKIIEKPSPQGQADGVYTANWAVTWKGKALLSRLPNTRQGEEAAAERHLTELGFECRRPATTYSGQGDTLIFNEGETILGHGYRTDLTPGLLDDLKWLGVIPTIIQTKPLRALGMLWRKRNRVSGLFDSYYYDIDLAVAVIAPNVLAVCFQALTFRSRRTIRALENRPINPVTIIPVVLSEARHAFACNLVSTGETVVMASGAPKFKADLERHGYRVLTAANNQFKLTGGGIRCVCLTLNKD
jgi:N-dimethylarginine dimethylaminohydrolase